MLDSKNHILLKITSTIPSFSSCGGNRTHNNRYVFEVSLFQLVKRHNGIEYCYVSTYEEIEVSLISSPRKPLRSELGNLDELTSSIKSNGLIEPIVVRPLGVRFEIVAGNRRYHACRKLNFRRIPAIVVEFSDQQSFEVALTENLQRKTMDPIEEAECFKRYCDEFGWGSESELALRIGKSQEYVSHRIKLLSLPDAIKGALRKQCLSAGTAEEIAWVEDSRDQEQLLKTTLKENLTRDQVREVARHMKQSEKETGSNNWLNTINSREELDQDERTLDRAILAMKISMVRLDSLIEKTVNNNLRNVILQKRVAVHGLLNELISYKKYCKDSPNR